MNDSAPPHLLRRCVAEFLGTALLVMVVVGSGTAAQRLSPDDVGLQLLENSLATALGLPVLILIFGPASGSHFNPVVTLADWLMGRRLRLGISGDAVLPYVIAQVLGGVGGALIANAMFEVPFALSGKARASAGSLLAEVVATAGLVVVIFALARTHRGLLTAPAVGAYIGAAYWFTSSTSFANPAVTIARMFSDTFAGIGPASVLPFLAAQILGGLLGIGVVLLLYPSIPQTAGDAVATAERLALD